MYKTNTNPMDYQPYDDNITTGKDSVSATEVFSGEPVMLSPTLYGGARLMFAKKVYTILSSTSTITQYSCWSLSQSLWPPCIAPPSRTFR